LEISRKNLNDIENGKVIPRLDLAYKIAVALDNILENLFIDEEYMKLGNIYIKINLAIIWLIYM
jgi:DNA-binding XRE family transcriptional regulator